eukprot:scaffold88953_cov63-Phaeocystis_antarctica.AAC.3
MTRCRPAAATAALKSALIKKGATGVQRSNRTPPTPVKVKVRAVLTMTPTPPTKLKHPATVPCRPAGACEATSAWLVIMLDI